MIKVRINNKQSQISVNEEKMSLFKEIARATARSEGYNQGEISLGFINNEEIQALNKKYRNKNVPTDVLSFPMGEKIWGDVLISLERAESQARDYQHSFNREVCFLIVHGVLHLLGYDHQNPADKDEMRKKEENILDKFDLTRES